MKYFDVIVVGGGAAGFFAAINLAELNPKLSVAILEKNKEGLQKVKISGGGRCNVTHAEFIPSELVTHYPRGEKELLGPFHSFMTGDTIEWFEKRGVTLKIEEDGRMFPESDSSQTIIDCFLSQSKKVGVEIFYKQSLVKVEKEQDLFTLATQDSHFTCEKLLVATGSSLKTWKLLETLGHTIIPPVPSLFTFNIKDARINSIPGVVANTVEVHILNSNLSSEGPLLVTHWGLSAPAVLKLSAFGALELANRDYKFDIEINFIRLSLEETIGHLKEFKLQLAKKLVHKQSLFDLPKRLWKQLVLAAGINEDEKWADLTKVQMEHLSEQLTRAQFQVDGKSTFKEEFVTAGGVDLKEINFKTFESKIVKNLYLAGEVINVDAITGGFNFQNAWTGGFLAAKAMSQ